MPDPTAVQIFASSLPESYRRGFDAAVVAEHARVAIERESASANVGIFRSDRTLGAALCVVADDKPGLLATISAALVACGLDVIEAEAYTRRLDSGKNEAVDLFWVRHASAEARARPLEPSHVDQLRRTLVGLLDGRLDRRRLAESPRQATPASSETTVRFLEDAAGSFTTLEVETGDRSGLLLALTQALFAQRVQIVGSHVKTLGARVLDRFQVVELDGSPIGSARRLEIQVAVISAIDPHVEGDRPSVV